MSELRKLERFPLKLTTSIYMPESGNTPFDLVTENICAGGAFFRTRHSLPVGRMVLAEFILRRESGAGGSSRVRVKGRVLRSQPNGMAVRFEKRVEIRRC